MNLAFDQVEAAFAARFDIPATEMPAFRARLQHLQSLDFPAGVNTGRGASSSFGWSQVIQLMVALDFIDIGLAPDLAAKSVRQNTNQLLAAIGEIAASFETEDALIKAMKKARCPFGQTRFAVASSYALTSPQPGHGAAIDIKTGKEFMEQLNKDPAVEPAAIFINLGARLMLVSHLIGKTARISPIEMATDLLDWSRRSIGTDSLS